MSLVQFLRIIYARRMIVLAALLGCFVIATITALLIPERYDAKTRVLLDVAKPDPVTGQSMADRTLRSYVQTQAELIRDYRTAGRVVDSLGWANDPALITQYNQSGMTGEMDIRRWLAQRIMDGTQAGLLSGTSILEITYSASSPEVAKRIADLIRAAYFEETLRFRRASAGRIAEWYEQQTARSLEQLRRVETERNEFAKANGIVLDGANTDLESAKLQALTAQSAVAGLGGGPTITAGGVSPLDQIDAQIAQAAMSLGPNHPNMVALKRQRAVLASAPVAQVRSGVDAAAIDRAFAQQKAKVLGQSAAIDRIRQMQTEIDLRRDQYLKSAQRVADYRLEANVGQTAMEPLGDALASDTPSFPNVPAIIAGSIAMGLGLGLVLALLIELLARRVRSDDDLSYAADAPVFAIIGAQRNPNALSSKIIRFLERKKNRQPVEGALA